MIPDAKFRRNFKFSLFFSLLAGKPGVETGSTTIFNRRFDLPMSGFMTYNPAQSSTEAIDGGCLI